MKAIKVRHMKMLGLTVLFAIFFSWQTALAAESLTISGQPQTTVYQEQYVEDTELVPRGSVFSFQPDVKGGSGDYKYGYWGIPDWMIVTVTDGVDGTILLENIEGRPNNGDVGIMPDDPIVIWVEDNVTTKRVYFPEFRVNVKNRNDKPTITNKAEIGEGVSVNQAQFIGKQDMVAQGAVFSFKPVVTDPDIDLGNRISPVEKITYNINPKYDWLEIIYDNNGVPSLVNKEGRPNNDDVISDDNPYYVSILASDNGKLFDNLDFTITINNANDAPAVKFDPQPAATVNQGTEWSAIIVGSDPDMDVTDSGETLAFTVEIKDENDAPLQKLTDDAEPTDPEFWLNSFTEDAAKPFTARNIKGTPQNGDVGKYKVYITVQDASGTGPATPVAAFDLEVVNVNDPPTVDFIIEPEPPANVVDEGTEWTASFQGADPDLEVDPAEKLTFTVEIRNQSGAIVQTLTDGEEASDPDFWLNELIINADDNPATKRFLSGTPENEDVGTYNIFIRVADAAGAVPLVPVAPHVLQVNNVNDAPTITAAVEGEPITTVAQKYFEGGASVNPGDGYMFAMDISDPDDKGLNVTVDLGEGNPLPPWLELVDTNGDGIEDTLRNKQNHPNNDDAFGGDNGVYAGIKICVSDGHIETPVCLPEFNITVTNVNDPPTIKGAPPVASKPQAYGTFNLVDDGTGVFIPAPVAPGAGYEFAPLVDDVDGDPLTPDSYVGINLPSWMELIFEADENNPNKPLLVNKQDRPNNDDVGEYKDIQLCVSDEIAPLVCIKFDVTITNVNDPPTIETIKDQTVKQVVSSDSDEDKTPWELNLKSLGKDVDAGETLTFTIDTPLPAWLEFVDTDEDSVLDTLKSIADRPNNADAVLDRGAGPGVYENFTICVNDGQADEVCSEPFNITVKDRNDPPTITGTPVEKIKFNEEYRAAFQMSDIENHPLIAWVENQPDWMDFEVNENKTEIVLTGTPTPGMNGQAGTTFFKDVTVFVADKPPAELRPSQIASVTFDLEVILSVVGDVNCDDVLDIKDAVTALQILSAIQLPAEGVCRAAGDVNGDGKISIEEVIYILRLVLLGYIDIDAEKAKMLIDSKGEELVVIDVSSLYADGHIPGAVNYPLADGTLDDQIPNLDKEKEYLVYCHTDEASMTATQKLVDAGLTVYRLSGNYAAWDDAGYMIDLTAVGARKMLDENPFALEVIDVSSKYAEGHLARAVNYPLEDGTLDDEIQNLDPAKKYLVYCHTDEGSISGAQKLIDAGFKVYRLAGNYQAWLDEGYDVVFE